MYVYNIYIYTKCIRNNVSSHLNGKVFRFHLCSTLQCAGSPTWQLSTKIHPCFGMLPALSIPVNTTMASSVLITLPKTHRICQVG